MSASSIPRFLLPQSGAIWRTRSAASPLRASRTIRNASTKPPAKGPLVLEKPTKFNPPSHGSRPRQQQRYPGPKLSYEEAQAQKKKRYPSMMPPEGTFMHWFINNRSIHLWITLGTLFSMAGFTWITNFKHTSKYAHMLPYASDLFFHPIEWCRQVATAFRMHAADVSAETAERRQRKVDDVLKRAEYRKAHGLETEGFGGWTAKTDEESLGPAIPADGRVPAIATEAAVAGAVEAEEQPKPKKPLKKWLGIW